MATRLPRPSTAPATKAGGGNSAMMGLRTAQEVRPLGRFRQLRTQTMSHGSNSAAVLASIKGEILFLQRKLDLFRTLASQQQPQQSPVSPGGSSDMEALERHLISVQPAPGNDLQLAEAKYNLMELLVERFKAVSVEALRACGVDNVSVNASRTSGFAETVDFLVKLGERKRLWDINPEGAAAAASALSTSNAAVQSQFDDAMNEPTASELRRLIDEQKHLQCDIRSMMAHPQQQQQQQQQQQPHIMPTTAATTTTAAAGSAASHRRESTAAGHRHSTVSTAGAGASTEHLRKLQHELRERESDVEDLVRKNKQAGKKITELEAEVKRLSETGGSDRDAQQLDDLMERDGVPEHDKEYFKKIGAVAFADNTKAQLQALGVDVSPYVLANEQEAVAMSQRVAVAFTEAQISSMQHNTTLSSETPARTAKSGGGGGKSGSGGKGGDGSGSGQQSGGPPGAPIDQMLWAHLFQQNNVVRLLIDGLAAERDNSFGMKQELSKEITRLQRVIAALEQRVQDTKGASQRTIAQLEAALKHERNGLAEAEKRMLEIAAPSEVARRIVNVKNQASTAAEREKELRDEMGRSKACIGDLRKSIAKLKHECEEEQAKAALAQRERASLVQLVQRGEHKAKELQGGITQRDREIQEVKDCVLELKKDLRDKAATEAEVQQRVWKLEVELHISQNVINEMRQRENALEQQSREARECTAALRKTLDSERRVSATQVAKLEELVAAANTEKEVAHDVLKNERERFIDNEREVERLRSLDVQMEVLEQNFANYAASKLAQREAHEEEERAMEECMEVISKDVFSLPELNKSEDEIRIRLDQLRQVRTAYDNEERVRRRNKATTVNFKDERSSRRQMVALMQQRYNAIQIWACEFRLRQLELERKGTDLEVQLEELAPTHEATLSDLAQAKIQCDSLVQNNTELEMERKELIRSRTAAEHEIKNLKGNISRIKISNEEQEKILVEVGTRLQNIKVRDNEPFEHVVIDPNS